MPKPKTRLLYTARKARAEVLELAGEDYPDSELKVTVTPIEGERSADKALARVARHRRPNNECITGEAWAAVEERYRKLGKAKTDSLVELEIRGGVSNFDFGGFYAHVDEISPR